MNLPQTAVVSVLSLAGCRIVPALQELDDLLRAEGVRSVAVEERFVLYSPYEPARTQRYVTAADRVLDELEEALGVKPGSTITVWLAALPVTATTSSGVTTLDDAEFQRVPSQALSNRRPLPQGRCDRNSS